MLFLYMDNVLANAGNLFKSTVNMAMNRFAASVFFHWVMREAISAGRLKLGLCREGCQLKPVIPVSRHLRCYGYPFFVVTVFRAKHRCNCYFRDLFVPSAIGFSASHHLES